MDERVEEMIGKIKDQVTDVADKVVLKTTEVVETQKKKSQIRSLVRNNERDFAHIGKLVYEIFLEQEKAEAVENAEIPEEAFEICDTIKFRQGEIEKIKETLKEEAK